MVSENRIRHANGNADRVLYAGWFHSFDRFLMVCLPGDAGAGCGFVEPVFAGVRRFLVKRRRNAHGGRQHVRGTRTRQNI